MSRIRHAVVDLALLGGTRPKAGWFAVDVVLAGALLVLDVPRVWTTSPGDLTVLWTPSALAVALVVLQSVPIAVRRLAPVPVLIATMVGPLAYDALDGQPEPDYLPTLIAVYTVAANVPPRVSRWLCAATAVLLPVALAEHLTVLGVFRSFVLITLVWALGLDRRRAIIDRARAAGERARQDAREQALRTAREEVHRRERIARNLHDALARSLTLVVLKGEGLKVGAGKEVAERLDGIVESGREALAAVRGALAALDQTAPAGRSSSWGELLASFRDTGLLIDADPGLAHIPLDDEAGGHVYRVVHEGLANVVRHAGPGCSVHIDVDESATGLAVRLTNDRSGDPPSYRAVTSGFGLASLERDVAVLGGVVEYGETAAGWELSARIPRSPVATSAASGASMARGSIPVVVVDDQAMLREGLRMLLTSQPDIDVAAEFADGAELLAFLGVAEDERPPPNASARALPGWDELIQRYPARPIVLLLDLVMPRVDGMAVLAALQRCRVRGRLRVLVLTTYGGQASVRRALALGADGYVLKDTTAEQLAVAIRAVAGGITALSPGADAAPAAVAVGEQLDPGNDQERQRLTPREAEVFTLLGEGLSNRAIAHRLALSERTVKIHVSRVLSKLGVQSRTQAALRAQDEDQPESSPRRARGSSNRGGR